MPPKTVWPPSRKPSTSARIGSSVTYRLDLEAQVAERTETLVASERRYRLLAETMKDVVWTMDDDQGILYVTPSIRELTGHDPRAYCALPPAQRYPQATLADMLPVGLIANELVTDHALHGGGRDLRQQGIRRLGRPSNRDEHR